MYKMFYGCSSLISLDLSNFKISQLAFIDDMFYGCSSLISLDLSNFDISTEYHDMRRMFSGCSQRSPSQERLSNLVKSCTAFPADEVLSD